MTFEYQVKCLGGLHGPAWSISSKYIYFSDVRDKSIFSSYVKSLHLTEHQLDA